MLNKIRKRIKGLEQRKVILDAYLYNNTIVGYAGGSLDNSNCLIVSNYSDCSIFVDCFNKEKANVKSLQMNTPLNLENIEQSSKEIWGTYEHIINCYKINDSDSILQLKEIYQAIQAEADYLVYFRNNCISTLTIVGVIGVDFKHEVTEAIEALIKGLSEVLGRHGIIVNGIIADVDVDALKVAKWSCLLSSKYGHILAGEVVRLANNIERYN